MTEILQPIQISIYFLERSERWLKEKPFLLDYTPEPPAIKSNVTVQRQDIMIEDIRGREHEFSYAKNGFCILRLGCAMEAAEFGDDAKIKEIYLRDVGESVKKALGATRVQIYDYTVRKRDTKFPTSTGEYYSHKQPSSIAHVDTTPVYMDQMLHTLNPTEADHLSKGHYQSVNIWKPLRGPLRDWPLALCDPRSIDPKDLQPRDTVKRESFIETYQVHYVPSQKWYYISDQMPEEAWLFLQADSSPDGMLGVPHTAFNNPLSSATDIPRESIEVRCFTYYDDWS